MSKQKAVEIRSQLKTLGYTSRDVSVRSDLWSIDQAVDAIVNHNLSAE